ncbi:MAG: hypothetical protein R3275_08080 [Saprospiraceae bacterium]|nr:hypothetical protein [Saprospiraceae bacterium]
MSENRFSKYRLFAVREIIPVVIVMMNASLVSSVAILDPVLQGEELLICILIRAGLVWALVGGLALVKR